MVTPTAKAVAAFERMLSDRVRIYRVLTPSLGLQLVSSDVPCLIQRGMQGGASRTWSDSPGGLVPTEFFLVKFSRTQDVRLGDVVERASDGRRWTVDGILAEGGFVKTVRVVEAG